MIQPASAASRAALLMIASAILFGFMAVCIRLAASELHAFEIAFFRNFFGLIFALPLLRHQGLKLLRTDKIHLYFLRCTIGMFAMLCGFWSLVHLPLAQAVALSYSTPLFVTIGAVFVLHEVVRMRRWSAVFFGFVGVLIILRPWHTEFSGDALIAVAAAAFAASAALSIKFLSRSEPAEAIVIYMVLIMTPMSLLTALPFWQWPNLSDWGWLVLTGFFGTAAHVCLTKSYQLGDASAVTSYNFVQLPVVAVIAYFLFGEKIDAWTIGGTAVIFISTIYIAHREAKLQRRAVTDATIAQQTQSDK